MTSLQSARDFIAEVATAHASDDLGRRRILNRLLPNAAAELAIMDAAIAALEYQKENGK